MNPEVIHKVIARRLGAKDKRGKPLRDTRTAFANPPCCAFFGLCAKVMSTASNRFAIHVLFFRKDGTTRLRSWVRSYFAPRGTGQLQCVWWGKGEETIAGFFGVFFFCLPSPPPSRVPQISLIPTPPQSLLNFNFTRTKIMRKCLERNEAN